jgi:hypothetical protein
VLKSLPSRDNKEKRRHTYIYMSTGRVGWVRYHHGMVRPQVADGGKSSGYGE